MDTHTATETMGRFAWLCVQIDIKKPLTTVVKIGRLEQLVSYEVINSAFHVVVLVTGRKIVRT